MSEFRMIDNAPLAPGGCMICGGLGPKNAKVMDLMQEFSAQQLRLYLCKIHYRAIAVAAGYAKGERMDELDKAAEQIVEIEKERDDAVEAAHRMAEEMTRLQSLLTVIEKERDDMRDTKVSLMHYAKQVGAATNELLVVGGGS